jgi:hypothetical protein
LFFIAEDRHTVQIVQVTTTNWAWKSRQVRAQIFEATFEGFLLEDGRTGGKVQQPVEGMIFEVLISARSYSCTDLARFSRQQVVGQIGFVSDSLGWKM